VDADTFLLFLTTSLLVVIAPGPGMLFVISSGLKGGRTKGVIAAMGTSSGIAFHIAGAALGLSLLIRSTAVGFQILKLIGAIYLIFLAWKSWRSSRGLFLEEAGSTPTGSHTLFWRGFLVNALNPKVAVFFVAFLPQFSAWPGMAMTDQVALLGMVFLILTAGIFLLYGIFAAAIRNWVVARPRFRVLLDRVTALLFFYLGIRLALARQN
jgi:threonine/homoserine/homoserine lactone efflux protein